MTSAEEEFKAIYGPSPRHSEHKPGEAISYHDAGARSGRNSGRILYVIAPTDLEPLRYLVTPDIGLYPVEVPAMDVIEL